MILCICLCVGAIFVTQSTYAATPDVKVGDYLIIHAGFSIEALDPEEASIRLDLFKELAEATQHEDYD